MKYSARIMLFSIVAGVFFTLIFSIGNSSAFPRAAGTVLNDSASVTLILLRHAKSDKSNLNMPDIERPLEASGRLEAEEMGDYLVKQNIHPEVIYSSPAVRTRQTLEIICKKIGYAYENVIWDSSLYACTGEHLQEAVKKTSNTYKTAMYVGHNPSMTTAANYFQSEQTIEEVKTCGVVNIEFYTNDWAKAAPGGELIFYAKPK
jgi:phosphohistidine phosphatase